MEPDDAATTSSDEHDPLPSLALSTSTRNISVAGYSAPILTRTERDSMNVDITPHYGLSDHGVSTTADIGTSTTTSTGSSTARSPPPTSCGLRGSPSSTSKEEARLLPLDFELTPYTVIIGRAKNVRDNLGNKRLKVLASNYLDTYSGAKNDKRTKSLVVKDLYYAIKNAGGKFVKQCKGGRYVEVSESTAKDKIGYVLRDYLADNYPSTSKSKGIRRSRELIRKGSEKLECAMSQIAARTSEQSDEPTPANLATSAGMAATSSSLSLSNKNSPRAPSSGFRTSSPSLASFDRTNPTPNSQSPFNWDDNDEIDELFP